MKYLLIVAISFLTVLWPTSAAQEPYFTKHRSSGLTGVRRNDHTIQALLKAQLKCLGEISAQRLAGRKPKVECPELDTMIEQTNLNAIVRYEIVSPLTPDDEKGIKYAILEAAYFGYRQGVRRSEER